MTAKILVLSKGVIKDELILDKKEITIGRDTKSDVYLNDPRVSRHHAKLIEMRADYYLEDLESTNGTLLNNRRVGKHILRNNDVLQVGSFELCFVDTRSTEEAIDPDKTVVMQTKQSSPQQERLPIGSIPSSATSRYQMKSGRVRYLRGPHQGKTRPLDRSLLTIGQPGEKMAVITRRSQGFFLLHLGGDAYPSVNDQPVQRGGVELHNGDIVDVGEDRLEILFDEDSE